MTWNDAELVNVEDFKLADQFLSSEKVNCAIHKFRESFASLMKDQRRDEAAIPYAYLSLQFGILIRQNFMAQVTNPRAAAAKRKRNNREKAKSKLKIPKVASQLGRQVSQITCAECEIIHWLRFNGRDRKQKAVMTKQAACEKLADWILILHLDNGAPRSQAIYKIGKRLFEKYKKWDPRQLPGLPKGVTINSGRPAAEAVRVFGTLSRRNKKSASGEIKEVKVNLSLSYGHHNTPLNCDDKK